MVHHFSVKHFPQNGQLIILVCLFFEKKNATDHPCSDSPALAGGDPRLKLLIIAQCASPRGWGCTSCQRMRGPRAGRSNCEPAGYQFRSAVSPACSASQPCQLHTAKSRWLQVLLYELCLCTQVKFFIQNIRVQYLAGDQENEMLNELFKSMQHAT